VPDAERKLAAILSADIVGYSRLMAEDEDETVRRLSAYREEIDLLVRQHRGRVADFSGDNFLAEFPTATDAVGCAVEIQGVLRVRNAQLPVDRKMEFRIGVHLGEVRVEDERLYGDGVNIAARLEGLAESGGICISAVVHDQVERRLDLGFQDLGEQTVKNIPKPVRVLRVCADGEPADASSALPGMEERTVPGFGTAPAIAVLPFDNLSGDPEQEYFADGLTEDLTTRLSMSASSGFPNPVIARNSSFAYKGQSVDVTEVSRKLGARYIVEGSVRRSGARVRISAQLIDAPTGHHLWAETYDRDLRDIFALQDEITQAIAASITPELLDSEWKRVLRREPQNLDAWDITLRGFWHLVQSHRAGSREENARARSAFNRAIELDPRYSGGFVGLAYTHWMDVLSDWTETPADSAEAMSQAARTSVQLDPNRATGHVALSLSYVLSGQFAEMISVAERAVELSPSDALARSLLGIFLAGQGRLEEGLASAEMAIRLSPRDHARWLFFSHLAIVNLFARRYEDAVEWARRSIGENPMFAYSRAYLAASLAHLGRLDESRSEIEELRRVQPGYSVEFASGGAEWFREHRDHFLDGLRKAGLPEK
jgi:adenylate cyclase